MSETSSDTPLLVGGKATHGASTHLLTAPWDGRPLRTVQMAGAAQVEAAIEAAVAGFEQTRRLEPYEKAQVLEGMVEGLQARTEEAVALILEEAGKPELFARGEVERCKTTLRLAADEARRSHGEHVAIAGEAAGSGRTGLVERFPVGPVAAITPFNFPLNLVAHKLAPAIAAGCSFVSKPAEQTPSAAVLLGELAVEAGYPAQAVNVIPCWRQEADALVTDPRLAALSFTGSAKVGWDMKARCGRKRVTLELGGNAAALICEDADLGAAVRRLAVGAFAYAGQVCISVQRVLVQEALWGEFVDAFVDEVKALPWGNPCEAGVISGPMIDGGNADRVQAWVQEALDAGATRLCGGGREGNTLEPTVLTGVPRDHRLYQEEVFGPVVMLEPFELLDQAIEVVNQSRWGLQVGVYTRDIGKLMRCFRGIGVGAVIHDDFPTFRVDHMPYGGIKDSGFGREGLRYAIEELTEPRLLVLRG